jgi:hypothetical protein
MKAERLKKLQLIRPYNLKAVSIKEGYLFLIAPLS